MKGLIRFSTLVTVGLVGTVATAAETIDEDRLNLRQIPYGMSTWPKNQLLTIRSPLVDAPVGSVYISQVGGESDSSPNLLETGANLVKDILLLPFNLFFGGDEKGEDENSPYNRRGRVIATLWGAKQGNCYLTSVFQRRFYGDGSDANASAFLNASRLEIGAGDRVVTLEAEGKPASFTRSEFEYRRCSGSGSSSCSNYTGTQYTLVRNWGLSGSNRAILAAMPSKSFKMRFVFDDHTQLVDVESGEPISQVYTSCRV